MARWRRLRARPFLACASDVVPTATIRPPCARRVQFLRRRASVRPIPHACGALRVSAAVTGRNVPAPTCSVTCLAQMPRAARFANSSSVKCKTGRRRGDGARAIRKVRSDSRPHPAHPSRVRRDIRRQRHLAFARDGRIERLRPLDRSDFQFARPRRARKTPPPTIVPRCKRSPATNFRAGRANAENGEDPRRLCSSEFDLRTLAVLSLARRAPPMQPRRNDFGIVDDHRVACAQKIRQIADLLVFHSTVACTTIMRAESRGRAGLSAISSSGSSKSN